LFSFRCYAGGISEVAIISFMIVLLAYVASHDGGGDWVLLFVLSFGL
jgi:hypothetical protein